MEDAWKEYKLGEIAEFKTGKLNSNAAVSNGKYPFFTCAPETYYIDDYAFDQKAILLAGNNAEGNFNIKYYEGKFNAYQRTYVINPINNDVDIHYLYYALQLCLQSFKALSQGTSTKFLTAKILNAFSLQIPSKDKQKRIVCIIKALDDKIENNKRINDNFTFSFLLLTCFVLWLLKLINDNLEQQAQALFKSWFVDFEPFKDGEFVESEMGMIPKGWKVGTLGELCDFKRGKNLLTKDSILGEVPVVAGGLEPSCYHNVANTKSPVITVSGSGANAGFMRMYYQEVWASDCSFIDSTCENLLFVYCFLTINRRLLRHAQTGAVQPHVKPADIHNFELVIPPKDIINRFQRIVSDTFTMRGSIEKESRRLAQLRDTLLPRLMSGELKVNEIEMH